MKIKVLLIASEHSSGMIPFASRIIKTLSKDERFDIYALVVNSGKYSYKRYLDDLDKTHVMQIEYPKSKSLKLIYKIFPLSIIKSVCLLKKQVRPDVIHFLTVDFTLAPYFLFHRSRKGLFYTVHDLYPHETNETKFLERLLHSYMWWGTCFLRRKIEYLVTSSLEQYNALKMMYPGKNVYFTHFPSLVTEQMKNGNDEVRELLNIEHYILFFGRIDEYKGVDLLIKAYNESNLLQKVKLVIAGKGTDYTSLAGNNKNIIQINRFINDAEIGDLFKKAALVVYPYRSATMSGVLSIAYYFRKKVLMSSVPFFLENRTEDSCFFKTGDYKDLLIKMEYLLSGESDSPESNSYEELYSDEVLANDYYNLYLTK